MASTSHSVTDVAKTTMNTADEATPCGLNHIIMVVGFSKQILGL
jgi:hypothetical protein